MSELSSRTGAARSASSRLRVLTLLTLLLLDGEFFIGMLVNLYVQVPTVHTGAGSSNYFLRIWLGKTADTIIHGRRVLPQKALDLGYQFQFATLEPALRDLVRTSSA